MSSLLRKRPRSVALAGAAAAAATAAAKKKEEEPEEPDGDDDSHDDDDDDGDDDNDDAMCITCDNQCKEDEQIVGWDECYAPDCRNHICVKQRDDGSCPQYCGFECKSCGSVFCSQHSAHVSKKQRCKTCVDKAAGQRKEEREKKALRVKEQKELKARHKAELEQKKAKTKATASSKAPVSAKKTIKNAASTAGSHSFSLALDYFLIVFFHSVFCAG